MNRDHPHRAGSFSWISFLVTGPEPNLEAFFREAPVEFFDRRGQTVRCRAHESVEGDRGQHNYELAVLSAQNSDVTLQDLVVIGKKNSQTYLSETGATVTISDCVENYPVVFCGSHGMKWGKEA